MLFLDATVLVSIFLVESCRSPAAAVTGALSWGYGYMIKEAMLQAYTWTRKKVPWQLLRKEQTVHLKACERSKLHADRQTFDHARNIALTHPRVLWDSSKLYSSHVMVLLLFKNQDSSIRLGLTGSHVPCLHVISCSCLLGCPFCRKKKGKKKLHKVKCHKFGDLRGFLKTTGFLGNQNSGFFRLIC